ncbi:SGNH/GDSL hydrolase family protein [Streptomyces sp. NPDC059835]|uniref:SGNH/GDSL hydrolase family protein n=1 Tax=Streptomyces sp. NPDC059835 TaxID=3346967 RepID=UPI00366335BA
MEHREAHSPRLSDPSNLATVGEKVLVEEHRSRGYVHRVHLALQIAYPRVAFICDNRGQGGATSRDLAASARALTGGSLFDLAVFGCGINDVWRAYQGRAAEAVSLEEYIDHYTATLITLATRARHVVCVSETPFGPIVGTDTAAMNRDIDCYNRAAARCAENANASFVDVWQPFTETARALACHGSGERPTLWSDGVHLSDLGVTLLAQQVETHLLEHGIVEQLLADTPPA